MLSAFFASRWQGTYKNTLLFYHKRLNGDHNMKLTSDGINEFLSYSTCGNTEHTYFRAVRVVFYW